MNLEVVEALGQLEREKGIPRDVLISALEAALISAFKRNYGTAQNVRVEVNRENGSINVYTLRTVVKKVNDPRFEISLEEAREIDPNYAAGDVMETEATPKEFGRIAAQTAKQVVMQKIREAERGLIYEEYSNKEGEVVTGIVQRHERRNVVVDLGRVEALMPPGECVPNETYSYGDRIKVYIAGVKKTSKGPQVIVSRTHPGLVKRLFELEIPEIYDGTVEIRGIAREPGSRTKIAVLSNNENVDAVGSCVGPKGMRVHKVVSELKGEKIDVVAYSDDPASFVANALSPARVTSVKVYPELKTAKVIVPDNQLSLAIGREGQNARLAAKLTGWRVDIKSESAALLEPAEEYKSLEEVGPDEPLPLEKEEEPSPEAVPELGEPESEAQEDEAMGAGVAEPPREEEAPAEPSDREHENVSVDKTKRKKKGKKKEGAEEAFEKEVGSGSRRPRKPKLREPEDDLDLDDLLLEDDEL